jgi:hypothetical protein
MADERVVSFSSGRHRLRDAEDEAIERRPRPVTAHRPLAHPEPSRPEPTYPEPMHPGLTHRPQSRPEAPHPAPSSPAMRSVPLPVAPTATQQAGDGDGPLLPPEAARLLERARASDEEARRAALEADRLRQSALRALRAAGLSAPDALALLSQADRRPR